MFSDPVHPFLRTAEHRVRAVEVFEPDRVAWGCGTTTVAMGFCIPLVGPTRVPSAG